MSHDAEDLPIGPVLRTLRKTRGYTIEEVARRAKLHWVYYGGIERQQHSPTATVIDRILTALRVSWKEFGAEVDEFKRPTSPPDDPFST